MGKDIKYFGYRIPETLSVFIGTEKSQIINTLEYYANERGQQCPIPSEEEISPLKEVNITCALPLAVVDHNVSVEARSNFFFHVNANAFDYIQEVSRTYEKLKRGDLFKFKAGADIFGLWFLPEYVMQGLREYDWEQHRNQINVWMNKREAVLQEGRRRGHLA